MDKDPHKSSSNKNNKDQFKFLGNCPPTHLPLP